MKRIRVPDEILSAVMAISSKTICRYCQGSGADDHPNEPVSPFESRLHPCPACRDGNGEIDKDPKTFRREIVEAVLRYISEHPQVPTDEQWAQLRDWDSNTSSFDTFFRHVIAEWQRRCFVQEEPEIDEIWMPFVRNAPQDATAITIYGANETVLAKIDLESYRLRKGEQK